MLELHIHPDSQVIIRENGAVIYLDSFDNFYADFGSTPEFFPEPRWNERIYRPNQMDRLGDQFTQETTNSVWSLGEDILAARAAIIAAKSNRLSN
jgi:hypothetical protein